MPSEEPVDSKELRAQAAALIAQSKRLKETADKLQKSVEALRKEMVEKKRKR